uniref:Uncharacterized protein n=1 Tax=Kalanchoe fedtschenkoi TaxID=63787 RepID=A0A7N0UGI6_KALFE
MRINTSQSPDSLRAKRVPLRVLAALMASLERRASRVSGKFKAKAADSRRLMLSVSSRIKRANYDDEEEERKGKSECCGVWQKAILMGDRCQPPDFSGVIYYDEDGKRIDQFPCRRSPRNSPLPSYAAAHDQLRRL